MYLATTLPGGRTKWPAAGEPPGPIVTMPCPDENTILRLLQRGLPAPTARRVEQHIDGCAECTLLVSELGRVLHGGPSQVASGVVRAAEAGPATRVSGAPPDPDATRTAEGRGRRGRDDDAERGLATTGPETALSFGRYVIERKLGEGGMGAVYLANDPVLGRRLAIKLIRRDLRADRATAEVHNARLLAEARAMARVAHPGVVAIFDAGVAPEGVFIAMEYVEGSTLRDWLGSSRRSAREILRVFAEAAAGLAAAHDAGILHRDFKPANVLIRADGRAQVADFGLARAAFGPVDEAPAPAVPAGRGLSTISPALTPLGAAVGTPAYMAPEQMLGYRVDARADQFSFAVALYEALYGGARPYRGKRMEEIAYEIVRGAQPAWPVSVGEVPSAITHAVVRAASPHPDGRFASMRAMLEGLRNVESPAASRALRVNQAIQLVSFAAHAAVLVYVTIVDPSILDDEPARPVPRPVPRPLPGTRAHFHGLSADTWSILDTVGLWAVFIVAGFTFAGLLWTPVNAWGLHRRRRWARGSTMLYAVLLACTCAGIPFAGYILWSLTRPEVKAAFGESLLDRG